MGRGSESIDESSDEPPPDTIVDPGDAVRLLRSSRIERGEMIERYADTGPAERDIAAQLVEIRPLAEPELFPDAHRTMLYALEVLDRNGGRPPRLRSLGPLRPLAAVVVGLIARWIARGHQRRLVTDVRRLCERREVIAPSGSDEQRMLLRARLRTARVETDYRGGGFGLPAFLIGGAAFSTVATTLEGALYSLLGNRVGRLAVGAVLLAVLFALAWCALRAAAVARRRIRMTTDAPANLLWATFGNCGEPPKDHSYAFAAIAMILLIVSWIAVPAIVYLIIG